MPSQQVRGFFNGVVGRLQRRFDLRILMTALVCLFSACSSTGGYNPTVPKYEINREALQKNPVKKLVIATANVSGEPTRYYLQKAAAHIDDMVKTYLQKSGYQIAPSYVFENAWNQATRTYGDMYDPTTGKVDGATWRAVMLTTMQTLQASGEVDAIVFTDVIDLDAAHDVGMDHLAQWDGVRRKPSMASAGSEGIPSGFNWGQPVKVASLSITIYSTNMEGVFHGRGGLDTLQALDTKDKTIYVRRKHILDSDDNIQEGIEIAFHPFIVMKNYPGDAKP